MIICSVSRRLKFMLVCLLVLSVTPTPAGATIVGRTQSEPPPTASAFRPGTVLVKFDPKVRQWDRDEVLADAAGAEVARTRETAVRRVAVPPGQELETLEQLRADPRVEYAELDEAVFIAWAPSDPDYDVQWGLPKIQAPRAWDTAKGEGVTVAVIDTGADLTHPDLAANLVEGKDFVGNAYGCSPGNGTPRDDHGHGTHVSGIIAAMGNNDAGGLGVAPSARVMPLKALDCNGSGYYSDIEQAIEYAADNGAQVINMSLAGGANVRSLRDAVDYAWSKGLLLVAAAGNSSSSTAPYPAGYSNVMAIGATTSGDGRAYFSNYGSYVSVGAPGLSIFSTYSRGAYAYMSGTSMATPMVAGVAAVILSTSCPGLTNLAVRRLIEDNADNIDANLDYAGQLGHGRVNVTQSLPATRPPTVSTNSLRLMAQAGDTQTQERTVSVSTGSCSGSWSPSIQSMSPDTGWLSVTAAGSPASSIVVTVDPSTLTAGQYDATVAVMPASGTTPLRTFGVQVIVASELHRTEVEPISKQAP